MTIQEQADAILARKCPDCTDGTQPSMWVDDEQPRKLCASCDGAGIVADDDSEPTEADELLLRLVQDRAALLGALKAILEHVEDMAIERMPPSQCTLCHHFRMIGHRAIERAERP